MKLVRGAWKLLVGIKDALVLILLLLFFGGLFALLSARPSTAIRDGALVVALDGRLVEQPQEVDPFTSFGGGVAKETRLRDVVRALDAARGDGRVKAVVLDLDRFAGGYPAAVAEVASAVGRVRASGKPVLAYATAYMDSSYLIAANASEIWVDPMGGAMFMGPGGSQLYYKGLIDKLGINVHVYRVGQFKSAVEPYTLTGQSGPARAANEALYGAIFSQWRDNVAKARPKARIADYLTQPDKVVVAANGDLAQANLAAGVVDKLGDRLAFGKRVAEIAGSDSGKPAGSFRTIKLADWVAANPAPTSGDAIGVVTVAGEIVDGKAGPGTAGGETVSKLLLDGLAKKNLKALVVRIDSPGGSALASERIRQAVLQAKAQGLPVVVSMGGLAASGGYWVATAGDAIFAEPNTITGSIGIFGILPTFENALGKIGVTADGVATTPLSGQPDVFKGTTPELDAMLQSSIENGYRKFIARVSEARKLSPERVNEIGQGRVWDGGTAHQLKLVDRFGTLSDAVAEAARRAKLDPAKVHPVFLEKEPKWTAKIAAALLGGDDDDDADAPAGDAVARIAAERRALFAQAIADARRLARGPSVQALCLECTAYAPPDASQGDLKLADLLFAKLLR
ncbi:signal peptide peptidase SppA [Sphingomonas sp. DT-204]|uniref:signal peptide peptidase SppA n=1 Tax=Sphingomonas sp. DT-204 TaxID=3396166 RepID=UPI003F193FCC